MARRYVDAEELHELQSEFGILVQSSPERGTAGPRAAPRPPANAPRPPATAPAGSQRRTCAAESLIQSRAFALYGFQILVI